MTKHHAPSVTYNRHVNVYMINKLKANLTNGQTGRSIESPAKQIVSKVDLLSIDPKSLSRS